jgi:2-keto-4-pentenoate hydratase
LRADAAQLPSPNYIEALAIQRTVQDHIGAVSGFKVARRADGPPVIAPIPAQKTYPSGASVPVRDRVGIELEIGFEVIAPPGPDPMSKLVRIFRPRLVLELVDTRLTGAENDALLKLADMQLNEGLVLGPALDNWDGEDFGALEVQLTCGAQIVISGTATVPGGSALANLALLCAHLGDHCGGLQVGQTVITGSLSGLPFFPAGTNVLGRVEGFGTVNCQLV